MHDRVTVSEGQTQVSVEGLEVCVTMPVHGAMPPESALALARLCRDWARMGVRVSLAMVIGQSIIDKARNKAAHVALTTGAEYVLWLDSDMTYDPRELLTMVCRIVAEPDVHVIGAAGRLKRQDLAEVYAVDPMRDADGRLSIVRGLIQAERLGAACLAMRRDVLVGLADRARARGDVYPDLDRATGQTSPIARIFRTEHRDGMYWGEDFVLCHDLRAAGVAVWLDPSVQLGHVGGYTWAGRFGDHLTHHEGGA